MTGENRNQMQAMQYRQGYRSVGLRPARVQKCGFTTGKGTEVWVYDWQGYRSVGLRPARVQKCGFTTGKGTEVWVYD